MSKTRFLMIGGFLGAGKTTTIAGLARRCMQRGERVGVVTNDQAMNLVDTETLRAQGFDVGEVAGACFCCKFDDLIETLADLSEDSLPDVILAEPVGSCTDLAATVLEPLRRLHGDRYEVGKLAVLCKPEHGRKILGDQEAGFSPRAAYLFLKQIEEADLVVVNKIDKLLPEEANHLADLVEQRFPGKEVRLLSARSEDGLEGLLESLAEPRATPTKFMPVDYDVYAEGEAELAWLNATATVESNRKGACFALDDLALSLVEMLAKELAESDFEPAHLKLLARAKDRIAVANLVSAETSAEISLASDALVTEARLVVNARVAGEPDHLAALVQNAVARTCEARELTWRVESSRHFRPGRPIPTHRMTNDY